MTAQRNVEPLHRPDLRRFDAGTPRSPARRALRVVAALVGTLIVLALFVLFVLADTPWGNERVRRIVVSQGNNRITGRLEIGRLRGNLLSSATLSDVTVVDSARQPLFSARRAEVHYALLPALRGRIVIESLTLDTATIVLDKRPGARWNFQSLMRPSTTPKDTSQHGVPPELADITLHHARFLYRRPWVPDPTLSERQRDSAIAAALSPTARRRTERVAGGYQRVLDYHDLDATLPAVRLAHDGQPTTVQIAALRMLAEPYRPPAIDVRSLTGTLYASRDSLWWRGARMALPASQVSGDGTIGFGGRGFRLDLTGAPVALADLRWLSPKLPVRGGGRLRYVMRVHADTSEYAITNADVRYGDATVVGNASIARMTPKGGHSALLVRGLDLTVAHLATSVIHDLAPSVVLTRSGTLDGRVALRGAPSSLQLDADVRFADASAGESHVLAHGGLGVEGGLSARDLAVQLRPLHVATLGGARIHLPIGGTLSGDATLNGSAASGWRVRGDVTHVEGGDRSRVAGNGSYSAVGKHIVADASLLPLSLATVGRFAPKAELRGDVTGRVHAEGTARDLRLSGNLRSSSGGGSLDGRGAVQLNGSRTRYDVSVALDALNAGAFSRRAPSTRLTGTIVARGVGTAPATANAVIAANLSRSRYDTFSVDRLRTRLAVAGGLLRVDTLDVAASGARAQAAGTLGLVRAREGALRFAAAVDSLGALRKWLGVDDTTSVAAAGGRQSVLLARARADSARRAEATRIERIALGLPEGELLRVDTIPGIRRDSLAGSLAASGMLHGNIQVLGVDATIEGHDLVARGNAIGRLSATVSSPDLRSAKRSVVFRADADRVQASGHAFESVQAGGRWQDQRLTGDVRVRQDSLVSYAALGNYERPAAGVQRIGLDSLSARFDTLVWRLAHPTIVRLSHGDIAVDSADLRSSAGGRLFANGVLPKEGPVHLDVAAENVRVSTVLEALQKDAAGDGVVAAMARIDGTRASPTIVGRATLRDATYGKTRAPDADVDLRYAARRLGVEATARDSTGRRVLAGNASLPLDLALESVTGSRKVAGPLQADVVLDSLSLAALPLSSRDLEQVRGMIAGDARVRGSWSTPEVAGRVALRGGGVTVVSTGMRVTNAVADLRLVGDTLRVDSVVVTSKGQLRAAGMVDLVDRAHPFVRLTTDARELRVMDATRGLLDVNADL
ncbi:MAG: hypothetical protein JWN53_791, partial [Gemmatimonadetes bacterium]|nr:hypothetical protein [Gemmatimonadota bacterium]